MRSRRAPVVVALVALVVLVAACESDQDPSVSAPSSSSTTSSAAGPSSTGRSPRGGSTSTTMGGSGPRWTTALTGAAEVPGPGDPDGEGTATIVLVPERSEVCFTIDVKRIDKATAAHIHRGAAGQPGDVELALAPPGDNGHVQSCAAADQILVQEMESSPSSFYVNVHTASYPKGALRGQLG